MAYLDYEGLAHYDELIKGEISDKLDADANAVRTNGILYGHVDATSTSTAFTATVDGLTELYDGACVMLRNGVVTSATGWTLDVNGLGALPVYSNMHATTRETTLFNTNYTMLFVYDSDRIEGGCWMLYRGYYSDANTIGLMLRTNSTVLNVSDTARYYKLYFTSADGTTWVPASVDSTNNATSARPVNQRAIDPFGRIVYTSASMSYVAGANLTATTIWDQYTFSLGYSFNRTGEALDLTVKQPVYLKCAPQADGSAIMDADEPIVQQLPTTKDGKIYVFLGIAYSATNIELVPHHPVYWHDGTGIRLWTGESAADLVMDALAAIATPDGPTATANHAVNTYLTMGGKLYKVTSAIAVGESIVAGTNVMETTVMDDTKMVILEYGVSTWDDFLAAYEANRVVYCRVSSPYGFRMAFLAFRQTKGSTVGAEFQYYRSRDYHTDAAQGDEVYIYHLSPNGTWTTTVRNAYTRIVAGTGLKSTYANGVLTISLDQ